MEYIEIDRFDLARRIYNAAIDQDVFFCTNEDGSDTYGAVKKIMFDETSLILNFLGGGRPFITDLRFDEVSEVADALRHYFNCQDIKAIFVESAGLTQRYGVFFRRGGYAEIEAESVEDAMKKADETTTSDEVSWDDDWPCIDAELLDGK